MNRAGIKKTICILARAVFLIAFVILWQLLFHLKIWSPILFPSLGMVVKAMVRAFAEKGLFGMVMHSLRLLITGLFLGIVAATLFSGLSVMSSVFLSVYNMIVSMFDLIPGIALIPVAILWLGVGDAAIVFMVFHSVVWPLSRSMIDGFNAVPRQYIEVGENIGLSKTKLLTGVFIPASLPRVFSGLKVGWARAWRGLISAEMVFGGGSALGIGYFITDRRTNLDVAGIFATIAVIIAIGAMVEYGLFNTIENKTIRKWGMVR